MGQICLRDVKRDSRVRTYIEKANEQMAAIGYTEHGFRHAGIVAGVSRGIIRQLGNGSREAELAAIAGYLHDIGNVINRENHQETGAVLAESILNSLKMPPAEIAVIMGAIGNHEEDNGFPINKVTAAVIIGDKSDVHFSRVQNPNPQTFDIHDRVNHAVQKSYLRVDSENKIISLELTVDTTSISVTEYFEIFVLRMVMCRRAADVLGCKFKLVINGIDL
ncbi:MAG: HD domain-containing protein [Armatimonadetes bacterium]|nr:HD domain-containing protein [Armatimonadota bacterium]